MRFAALILRLAFVALATLSHEAAAGAAADQRVRLGVLAFGTVNWELAAAEAIGLARDRALVIVPTVLASSEAAKIALQGDTVDIIVADWIWVARQRSDGKDYTFVPYSTSHGALVIPSTSGIRAVGDLKGKKVGVVGGGLDKNWLMLKALARETSGLDLDKDVDAVFGAPPLLNQQLLQGRLDALLDYWHYAVKLEAQGYRVVLDGRSMLRGLGVEADLANLGFVFRERWARQNSATLKAFLEVSGSARAAICAKDDVWQTVLPLTHETDVKVTGMLRQRYCQGGRPASGEQELKAAERLYGKLRESGGIELTGTASTLPPGVFWPVRP